MLFRQAELEAIAAGRVTLAFRRWKRPTVRAGGTLRTPVGVLAILAVDAVATEALTPAEAVAAGFADLPALRAAIAAMRPGSLTRIRFRLAGADPRLALRQQAPDGDALAALRRRLAAMDARSPDGPWTTRVLGAIAAAEGEPAAGLAAALGMERDAFKRRVRALKELGLTESPTVGYRLSPRGRAVLGDGARA